MNPTLRRRAKRAPRKQRLTELSVRKAKATGRATITWDTLQRGLALRVQPSGGKSWYYVYSRHGRPRWLRLGNADAIGLADARTKAAEAMLAVRRGSDPAADKKAERGSGTFADLHARYLDQHAKRFNKSWKQADALIRRHVLPRWAKLEPAKITRSDVKAMMARIEAPIAANQTLAAVGAVFTWAVKEDLVNANPCKLVSRNPTQSRERVLAASEVPQVWAAFGEAGTEGAALRMILLTGQRPGEVAHMRREHLKDGWWEMPGEPIAGIWPGTKNAKAHRVWIPKPAQELIAALGVGNGGVGYVFAGPLGGALHALDKAMRESVAGLALERATPHDLRRTHGSTITGLGFGRDAMNRIQNHREGGIADVYDRHGYEAETRKIMEAVAARIMALAEGRPEDDKVVALKRSGS
jgi:integrase